MSLKGRALRLLAGREQSRTELERKLGAHAETPEQLAQVLDELQAKDFISEARVAESVINRRSARLGAARVRHELLGKGLGAEVVREAMQRLNATELERAQEVWRKKFDGKADSSVPDASARLKQMQFLAARGFDSEVVRRVVANADADN